MVDVRLGAVEVKDEVCVVVGPSPHGVEHGSDASVRHARSVDVNGLGLERGGGERHIVQSGGIRGAGVAGVHKNEVNPVELLNAGCGVSGSCGEKGLHERGQVGLVAQVGALQPALAGRVHVKTGRDLSRHIDGPRLPGLDVLVLDAAVVGPGVFEMGDGEGDVVHPERELEDDAVRRCTGAAESEVQVRVLVGVGGDDGAVGDDQLQLQDVVTHHAKFSGAEAPASSEGVPCHSHGWAVPGWDCHLACIPEG